MDVHPRQFMTDGTRVAHPTVVICVALLIGGCMGGQGAGDVSLKVTPTASLPSDESSAPPSPVVRPLRDQGGEAILDPGTYVLDLFPVDLAFDIPAGGHPGWHVGMSTADAAVVLWFTPPEITYGVEFRIAENVYVDPCDTAAGELVPPIGPSVDDLVAALSNQPEVRTTTRDVTVGDFSGKEIELTALHSGDDCPEVIPFRTADDDVDIAPGDTLRLRFLDVDGFRVVLYTPEPEQADPVVEAEVQQILGSLRIQPLF
jgi:hypothetical protein